MDNKSISLKHESDEQADEWKVHETLGIKTSVTRVQDLQYHVGFLSKWTLLKRLFNDIMRVTLRLSMITNQSSATEGTTRLKKPLLDTRDL